MSLLALVTLLLLAVAGAADTGANAATAGNDVDTNHSKGPGKNKPPAGYVYEVPVNRPLQRLPGAAVMMPKSSMTSSRITLAPVTYRLFVPGQGLQVEFTQPGYIQDGGKQQVAAFGPTLRLARGQSYDVTITNALVDPNEDNVPEHGEYWFGPGDTNLHLHGLHAATGVPSQATATEYKGDDNIFVKLKARSSAAQRPNTLTFRGTLPSSHLPGLAWAHAHKHGSTFMQVSSAHFAVLVEDDFEAWMPQAAAPGCAQVRKVLEGAPDAILDLQLFFFQYAADPANPANEKVNLDNANLQIASKNASNPYCCDKRSAMNGHPFMGGLTQGLGANRFLINGGYQPRISLQHNTWTRWRFLFSGAKGFAAIAIVDPSTNQVSPDCEMQLIAKDGIYLPLLPRKVQALLLPSGGRVEVLVRCSSWPGKPLTLSAGAAAASVFSNSSFGNLFYPTGNPFLIQQELLASISVQYPIGMSSPSLAEEACKPLRPAYAADLRDNALAAAGYQLSDVVRSPVQFTFNRQFACEVNNQSFIFPDPNPLTMNIGTIQQWDFNDAVFHPLHVHTNPFQLVGFNKALLEAGAKPFTSNFYKIGDYYDTLLFPFYTPIPPDALTLRFQPGAFTGYSVMHCHYLMHEDLGCMKVVLFKCPGFPDDAQPADGECPGYTPPVPGTATA